MQRIVLVGASGSGKTTLGRWLSKRLNLPFTDLDDVFWRPGWVESPTAEFRAAVADIGRGPRWVAAGNYSKAHDLLWPCADTLIWLDLPLTRVLWRTTVRAARQSLTGEPICNGNRQTLAALVKPPDSLLGYTLRTFHARRRKYSELVGRPEYENTTVVRLRSAAAVTAWQKGIIQETPLSTNIGHHGRTR